MPGPCSLPNGGSRMEYASQWDLICNVHKDCTPDSHTVYTKSGDLMFHDFVNRRTWLAKRNKLRTGKTR